MQEVLFNRHRKKAEATEPQAADLNDNLPLQISRIFVVVTEDKPILT